MEFYSLIDSLIVAAFDSVRSFVAVHIGDLTPAAIGEFWRTNQGVASGVDGAQVAAAVLSALFAFVIVVAVLGKRALKPATVPAAPASEPYVAPGQLASRWATIAGHLDSAREADWKVAVLEADKLTDDALAKAGFPGDSFGDRLTAIAPGTLVSLDGLWWAHKVRNRLAHETDYFLRYTEAKQAVGYFQQALQELKLL